MSRERSYPSETRRLTYRGLGHPVLIRNAWPPLVRGRNLEILGESNIIVQADVLLPEEPKVQDDTRIGSGSDISIRKRIAVNLDVILGLVVISDHELRFGVTERDRQRVGGVFGLVSFDCFFVVRVGGDSVDYAPLEDDLWRNGPIRKTFQGKRVLLEPGRKSSTARRGNGRAQRGGCDCSTGSEGCR